MSDEPSDVIIAIAAQMLDYSEATVRRMLRAGVLDSYGSGRLLRVNVASIREYKEGKRTWHRNSAAGRAAQAPSSGSGTGRTSPAQRGASAVVDFPIDRVPKKH